MKSAVISILAVAIIVTAAIDAQPVTARIILCTRPANIDWTGALIVGDTLRFAADLRTDGVSRNPAIIAWSVGDTTYARVEKVVKGVAVLRGKHAGVTYVQATAPGVVSRFCLLVTNALPGTVTDLKAVP